MAQDPERGDNGDGAPSPEERYRKFEEENAEWSRRVEKPVRELDEVTKGPPAEDSEPDRAPA